MSSTSRSLSGNSPLEALEAANYVVHRTKLVKKDKVATSSPDRLPRADRAERVVKVATSQ
jgi:hypothetical protein